MHNSQAHTQVCVHTESYSCANIHVSTHERLESPLDSKAINTKGQSILKEITGRTDAETEVP